MENFICGLTLSTSERRWRILVAHALRILNEHTHYSMLGKNHREGRKLAPDGDGRRKGPEREPHDS